MSFSVVQKTTTGASPPSVLRSSRRKSMPLFTGMFQSSSMTSGIWRKHASRASWPSAASSIENCKSSRMRRATLRTTRESSTIRQDFMIRYSVAPGHATGDLLGGFRPNREVQHTSDVKYDQQRLFQAINAAGDFTPNWIQRRRVALRRLAVEAEHLAHGIDHDAIELAAVIDDDAHALLTIGQRRHAQPRPQIDRRDDTTPEI